ncbi:MAG: hypothetical protein AAF716_09185, partial [Cyanobacteria bacterium P01_D01_bin.1]
DITSPTWTEMTSFAQMLPGAMLLASQQKLQTAEVQVKNTTQTRLWLEITLTGLLPSALSATTSANAPAAAANSRAVLPVISTEPTGPDTKKAAANPAPTQKKINTPTVPKEPSLSEKTTSPKEPTERPIEKSVEKPAAVAFGSLADLWKQILAVLQPRGTQMLMSQQGVLLGFDGVGAKVGFRSAPLQKAARERVPNLEAAFQKVFQRPIQISLEIVSAPIATESAAESDSVEPSAPMSTPIQPPATEQSSPNNASNNADFRRNGTVEDTTSQNEHNRTEQPAADLHRPTPLTPPDDSRPNSSRNPRLEAPADMQFLDQDQEKIKRFANFFNGQIVNLEDNSDSPLLEPSTQDDNDQLDRQPGQRSTDPGPDVPF